MRNQAKEKLQLVLGLYLFYFFVAERQSDDKLQKIVEYNFHKLQCVGIFLPYVLSVRS